MPVTPTYPGVYIEEIPSGVRTITGVATSITAFIGRARRGPVNRAWTINSFADFERVFGGLWVDSAMSYAVRDFYLNGGSQAIIVRLFSPSREDIIADATSEAQTAADAVAAAAAGAVATATTPQDVADTANAAVPSPGPDNAAAVAAATAVAQAAAGTVAGATSPQEVAGAAANAVDGAVQAAANAAAAAAPVTKARLAADTLNLEAAYEGDWGNHLRARVDHDLKGDPDDVANNFNLSIRDGLTGQVEVFRNLSVKEADPRYVKNVLDNQSRLMRVLGAAPATRPDPHPNPGPGEDVWGDNTPETNTKVANADKASDGNRLVQDDFIGTGKEGAKRGLFALEQADLFNLLCIPPYLDTGDVDADVITRAATYCEDRRAMLLVDPPSDWTNKESAKNADIQADVGTISKNAAIFFPRLRQRDPERDNQWDDFAPCGAVAGVFARTDTQRGVWKAPAGLEATLAGVPQLSLSLTDAENGGLNPLGINCLRTMPPAGRVIWGSRTLQGDDRFASEWKYIPVRRTALFIEESLYRGTQWVVFEPNDEPLWAQIRLNVGAFMHNLFRQGAFQGRTPREAYLVKCDRETTTQNDIDQGIVNIVVGFAPLKPAEFVIIKIQQLAGQIEV